MKKKLKIKTINFRPNKEEKSTIESLANFLGWSKAGVIKIPKGRKVN